jgi:signal transduction histidine kinase
MQVTGIKFKNKFKLYTLVMLPIRKVWCRFVNTIANPTNEYKNQIELEKKSALVEQAARVAHDIGSPIATLEMSLHLLSKEIHSDKLTIMKAALQNVRDIANNLLIKYRENPQVSIFSGNQFQCIDDRIAERTLCLRTLIDDVLMQKRYEWLDKSSELIFTCSSMNKSVEISAEPDEVKRMISNLLNNAIEACGNTAKISIHIEKIKDFVHVSIIDNGVGIPDENIKLYLAGESSKHIGRGMGLSNAYQYIKSIGGELTINSQLGKGTCVCLAFRSVDNSSEYDTRSKVSAH